MAETQIRWRLREVMARYNITGRDLAKSMNLSESAMVRMRSNQTMPRIGGDRLKSLCDQLNHLATEKDKVITPADLIEYSQKPS